MICTLPNERRPEMQGTRLTLIVHDGECVDQAPFEGAQQKAATVDIFGDIRMQVSRIHWEQAGGGVTGKTRVRRCVFAIYDMFRHWLTTG